MIYIAAQNANACLTCTSFRTDASFLHQHERQLQETNAILKTAKEHGWHRQVDMNHEVKINLETIIASLIIQGQVSSY